MAEPTQSSCSKAWGLCIRDARCEDTACPVHPAQTCSACAGGRCRTPTACQVPEPTPAPRKRTFRPTFEITGPHLPRTRAGWGRVLQTGLGIAGFFFIAGAVGRHLGVF